MLLRYHEPVMVMRQLQGNRSVPIFWRALLVCVDSWIVRLVQAMYNNSRSRVRVGSEYSEEFKVGVGVHQGSVLSPLLFIIVLEALSRDFRGRVLELAMEATSVTSRYKLESYIINSQSAGKSRQCIGRGSLSINRYPDGKVHGANMGPTWVLLAPDGPHVGPMNLAIRVDIWPV